MEDDDRKVCDCAADGRNGDLHFRDKANKQLDHSTFDFVVTAFVSKQSTSKKKNPSKFLWCLLITPWSLTPFKEGTFTFTCPDWIWMALAQAAHCWQNFRSQTIEQVGRWQKMTSRCDFNTNSAYPSWIWTEGKIHCGLVACRSQTQPFICPMDNLQCNEAKVNMQEAGMSLNRDWGGGGGGGTATGQHAVYNQCIICQLFALLECSEPLNLCNWKIDMTHNPVQELPTLFKNL